MYTINIVKTDYEGWWLFDNWQEQIIVIYEFLSLEDMLEFYQRLIQHMHAHFSSFQIGKYNMLTFYNCCDVRYCDDCDDDVQMYVSPIMMVGNDTITDKSYYKTETLNNF